MHIASVSFVLHIKVAIDAGCERIHKDRKMQTAKFYSLSQIEKGPGVDNFAGPGGWGFEVLLDYTVWEGLLLRGSPLRSACWFQKGSSIFFLEEKATPLTVPHLFTTWVWTQQLLLFSGHSLHQ